MGEIVEYQQYNISTHDFESSKNKIKKFSEKAQANPELSTVTTSGGLFGWFDHKVTGNELNSLTSQIQNYLIGINSLHIDMIEQFGEVYKTFEALDNDYIKGILISMGGLKKTNEELKVAQKDIKNTIEVQKRTIKSLSGFKEQLEKYKHLGDVDVIWSDISKAQRELSKLESDIKNAKDFIKDNSDIIKVLTQFKAKIDRVVHIKDLDKLWDDFKISCNDLFKLKKDVDIICKKSEEHSNNLAVLCDFRNRLVKYKHIDDIDDMWESLDELRIVSDNVNVEIVDLKNSISVCSEQIDKLFEFKKSLEKNAHLYEIDELWNDCLESKANIAQINTTISSQETHIEALSTALDDESQNRHTEIEIIKTTFNHDFDNQQLQLDNLNTKLDNSIANHQAELEEIKTTLVELQRNATEREKIYRTKLRIACIISGCSLGVALVELILLFLRVL